MDQQLLDRNKHELVFLIYILFISISFIFNSTHIE